VTRSDSQSGWIWAGTRVFGLMAAGVKLQISDWGSTEVPFAVRHRALERWFG